MFSRFQGRYAEAEPLYKRAQAIREKVWGPKHQSVASILNERAGLLKVQVRTEARRSLGSKVVRELLDFLGAHPCLAMAEYSLDMVRRRSDSSPKSTRRVAMLSRFQGNLPRAESLYDRVQSIWEKVLGPEHPHVADVLYNRGLLLKKQVRVEL